MRIATLGSAAATISVLQSSATFAEPLSSETALVNTRFNRVIDLLTSLQDELEEGGEDLRAQLLAALQDEDAVDGNFRTEEGIVDAVLHAVKHIVHPVTHLVRCLVKCVTHVVDYSDEDPDPTEVPTDLPQGVVTTTPDIATLLRNPWSQRMSASEDHLDEKA